MLSKISLMASTLGLALVGTGVEPIVPAHIKQLNIASAYEFSNIDACHSKLHALYAEHPMLKDKLRCTQ